MPTIDRRYESAIAALEEISELAVRFALAIAEHHPDGKKVLDRLRRDHINSAFRVAGDDATIKSTLENIDARIAAIALADKTILPAVQARYGGHRNLGTRRGDYNAPLRPKPRRV
jgi:hypothetical protein